MNKILNGYDEYVQLQIQIVMLTIQNAISINVIPNIAKNIRFGRWENCREQGYVISVYDEDHKQLNICFYENRYGDEIHAISWEQSTLNTPNLHSSNINIVDGFEGNLHKVGYGKHNEMAMYIVQLIASHLKIKINYNV